MSAGGLKRHQLIANILLAIYVRDVWARENRNRCVAMFAAYCTQRWKRHDRVAYPIRGSNQNLQFAAPRFASSDRAIATRNSFSGTISRSITATYTGNLSNKTFFTFCSSFSVVTNA